MTRALHRAARQFAAAAALFAAGTALAQGVQFSGAMGMKALLVIDGQTKMLAPGESHAGVKLLALSDSEARIERGGQVSTLRLGAAPVALGGTARQDGGGREIVLPVGPGGHFLAQGTVNGRAMQFMVDTGATSIALSQADAERIGIDWRNGRRGMSSTANGPVVVHQVTLGTVRIGEVTVSNVEAVVVPAAMPFALLGNSFLGRFQMRRDNDTMRLQLKP
jgi:aspartyl protease family protein